MPDFEFNSSKSIEAGDDNSFDNKNVNKLKTPPHLLKTLPQNLMTPPIDILNN